MIFTAPLLAAYSKQPTLTAVLYLFFTPICHQNPARSFSLLDHALTVCHRCTGIYVGLFLGSLIRSDKRLPASPLGRRVWVLCATAPLLFDVALPYSGIWTNNSVSRFTAGLIFGAMLSALLMTGVAELTAGLTEKLPCLQALKIKRGIS